MLENLLEEITTCRKRQQRVITLNVLGADPEAVNINTENFIVLPKELDGITGKLISEINRYDCQVFIWEVAEDQEYSIDTHHHTMSNELLFIVEGEIIRLEDGLTLGKYESDFIPSGISRSYLLKGGSKLLVIFIPSVKINIVDG